MLMAGGKFYFPKPVNGHLVAETYLEEPRRSFLSFYPNEKIRQHPGVPLNEIASGLNDHYYFLAMPGTNKLYMGPEIAKTKITVPSAAQEDFNELMRIKSSVEVLFGNNHAAQIAALKSATIEAQKDSLLNLLRGKYSKIYTDSVLGFVRSRPKSPAVIVELEEYGYNPDKERQLLITLLSGLDPQIQALPTARRIRNMIDSEDFAASMIGMSAPDFVQQNTEGKAIAIKDYLGKVTLLEFWASWCGPCRAANPALVSTYAKYKPKGFSILGVSLDENKAQWLQAIKDDQLEWEHVSDLKHFENSVAKKYHISGIPSNFLIDQNGKIVATNLNEVQLIAKLDSLLKP